MTASAEVSAAEASRNDARARTLAAQLLTERRDAAQLLATRTEELVAAQTELGVLQRRERARLERRRAERAASMDADADADVAAAMPAEEPLAPHAAPRAQAVSREASPQRGAAAAAAGAAGKAPLDAAALRSSTHSWFDTAA
jgi:hypothetical protein